MQTLPIRGLCHDSPKRYFRMGDNAVSRIESLQRKIERERNGRKRAEALLEQKSRDLFKANKQLRDLADRTRAIIDTAPEGIITYDCNGTILSINRSAQKIFKRGSDSTSDIRDLFVRSEEVDDVLLPLQDSGPERRHLSDAVSE